MPAAPHASRCRRLAARSQFRTAFEIAGADARAVSRFACRPSTIHCASPSAWSSRSKILAMNFPLIRCRMGIAWIHFCASARSKARASVTAKFQRKCVGSWKRNSHLIAKLGFAGYFLIVWDIAEFCRDAKNHVARTRQRGEQHGLFLPGHHRVDPMKFHTLFERFLSEGRRNAGRTSTSICPAATGASASSRKFINATARHGAAMTANVITYRGRSAAREIGKALNIGPDVLDRFSAFFANGDFPHTLDLLVADEGVGLAHGTSARRSLRGVVSANARTAAPSWASTPAA